MNGTNTADKSIGALVKELAEDLSTLVRSEIALAKLELKQSAATFGIGGAMLFAALFCALFGLAFLFVTAVLGLVVFGVPAWLSTLIVALLLLGGAAGLAVAGKAKLKKLNFMPSDTIDHVKNDIAAIKGDLSRLGHHTS